MSAATTSNLVKEITPTGVFKILSSRHKTVARPQINAVIFGFLLSMAIFACHKPLNAEPAGQASKIGKISKPTFFEKLADAALERTANIVIYNPKYYSIPYPGGDVPAHFGVCSDVIVRSYRAVGIDLQKQVHEKLGGDKNIAHRRVRVLEKLFARYGKRLPKTTNPDDYKPGDIVTYHIPEAISSTDHIAIVSNKRGTSGAYMIIHNIGLGPKLDDDLFSFKITGHYRYGG